MNEEPTIQLILDAEMTSVLLNSVAYRLERWPGGDPYEQEYLTQAKALLFAAALEFQFSE